MARSAYSVLSIRSQQPRAPLPSRVANRVVSAIGALAIGLWLGFDLRGELQSTVNSLFTLFLATTASLPLAALGCLYHERLHVLLLPWPIAGRQHWAIGVRQCITRQWPWLVILLSASLTAMMPHGWPITVLACVSAFNSSIGSWAVALGFAGISALVADADGPFIIQLRASLAGPFASQRHAPFFYLPALAFASSAVVAQLSQELGLSALGSNAGTIPLRIAPMLWLSSPLVLGVVAMGVGAWCYARHALKVIPRVHEEARMVYGGRPAPADPPYGSGVARWLPSTAAAVFSKELREQDRAQRGLWAVVALAAISALIYGVSAGSPARAAPTVGLVLVIWVSTLPVRRAPSLLGLSFLRTLPQLNRVGWLGRWLALTFVSAHVALTAMLALVMRDQSRQALVLGLALIATTVTSISTTQPARRDRRGVMPATLVPAMSLLLGLAALAWFPLGLIGLVALPMLALLDRRRLPKRPSR